MSDITGSERIRLGMVAIGSATVLMSVALIMGYDGVLLAGTLGFIGTIMGGILGFTYGVTGSG